ncbi:MAG: NAD(P)H-binding protein [Bacteroidales bacterium]|nr:NAD(P)H-binding protein [Bacteroidales bacterium]MBN2818190.1 NAD(P)H-binding protein [Bacteroidales bacterium]
MKKALVFGGTGLVGSCLLEELSANPGYSEIKSFVRKMSNQGLPKVQEYLIDFDKLEDFKSEFSGDEVFICLGTTIKKAGSVANMEVIDRDYPNQIAKLCKENMVNKLAIVSSIGAKSSSKNYYLRIKGEMENSILNLDFAHTAIVRPSILLGDRKEKRFGEAAGKVFIRVFGILLAGKLKKYRAIHGRTVARAMIKLLTDEIPGKVYESDRLYTLGS